MNNTPNISLIPVKQCIFEAIDQAGYGREKYRRLYPIAIRGCYDLGVDVFLEPIQIKLDVNTNMTVKIPENAVKVLQAGVLSADGKFSPLKRSDSLTTYGATAYNRQSINQDSSSVNVYNYYNDFFEIYYMTYPFTPLFGVPGGSLYQGEYRVDNHNGLILLDNTYKHSYIILECLMIDCEENMRIPIECREALISWLAWKSSQYVPVSRMNPMPDRERLRSEYYVEKRNAKRKLNPIILNDYYELTREMTRLTPKT